MSDKIRRVEAQEILSGSGRPTVGVTLWTEGGTTVHSSVPSGTSKGKYEAFELYDGEPRYRGLGVRKAVRNVNELIAPALVGHRVDEQRAIDDLLLDIDGTENLRNLGGNAVLAVSLAAARAAARSEDVPLYRYLGGSLVRRLPVPIATVIAGGAHSPSTLDFEDYILIPDGFSRFSDALEALATTRVVLEELLTDRFGPVADIGGALAPPLAASEQAFDLMMEAVETGGYGGRVQLGLDVAASALYRSEDDTYVMAGAARTREEVIGYFRDLTVKYPLVFIEDPFDEDDFDGFTALTEALKGTQIVGDDLFASNPSRIAEGIRRAAANAVLLKVNQIGTVSGALDAGRLALDGGYSLTVSLRSSDTNDSFIADLAVSLAAPQIKLGSPVRGERNAKYNRLLAIELELGERAVFAGAVAARPGA
jgi:enolase